MAALHPDLYSEKRRDGMGKRRSTTVEPVSRFLAATDKEEWVLLLAASTLLPAPHTPPDVDAVAAVDYC